MADEKKGPDWLAIGISLFSLSISGLTAYVNILMKNDDVQLVPGYSVGLYREEKGDLLLDGQQQLTFLNAGNRAAVIVRIGMTAFKRSDDKAANQICKEEKESDLAIYLFFDGKPVVVKPGEIQVIELKPIALFPWQKAPDQQFRYPRVLLGGKASDFYLVCLEVVVTAPDSPSKTWLEPLYILSKDKMAMAYIPKDLFQKDKALSVLKRVQTPLDNWL